MRVLLINSVCGIRSTGRICTDIAKEYEDAGYEVKIAYGREEVPEQFKRYAVRIGSAMSMKWDGVMTRIYDAHGFSSKHATKKFLEWADAYNPEVLWLHNLHGYYINVELLFAWIKKRPTMQVKWTLHDCWAFTGHCAYFSMVKCNKWQEGCTKCPQKNSYPASYVVDNSFGNFQRKKQSFTGVKNMTIITPSQWLADLVGKSFLKEYPVEVHYNTIDTTVFKPTVSDFRKKYELENKKIILGVASIWDKRKGLDDFVKLSSMLDERFAIVLVGLDAGQMANMPKNVISIGKTNNIYELVEIYSAADIFVNPSKEETFGMTTVEARACGTEVIVYQDTACEEIAREQGGVVVKQSVDAIYNALKEYFGI